ncbi:MAG: YdcF family protein [Anaerolineae bacterium]
MPLSRRFVRCLFPLLALLLFLPFASLPLTAQETLQHADAILVIGGDHKPERIARTAQLYRDGYAPFVLISAGTIVQEGDEKLPEAQVMLGQALKAGIPRDAILLEQDSQTTLQNAVDSHPILEAHQIRSILLVTSAYHSRRAHRMFSDLYGDEIEVNIQPAFEPGFCALCWPVQPDQAGVVLSEYWKWGIYLTLHQ